MEQETRSDSAKEPASPVSRRALLKAGWVIPAIMVVGIPKDALAMTGSDYSGGGGTYDDHDHHYSYSYSWSSWWGSYWKKLSYRWSWWGW